MANKNNLEIERRYLLKNLPLLFKTAHDSKLNITQFYHPDGSRYRISQTDDGSIEFIKTVKKHISAGVNEEIEHSITPKEFNNVVQNCTRVIRKTRYVKSIAGLVWEVDVFDTVNLVIAEVELEELIDVDLPVDLKSQLLLEITGMKNFSNFNLSELFVSSKNLL